jgi:tetratricopeptide (TPR) repeat protein
MFAPHLANALGDKVEAGSCAIANSGSASGNTVTCNFGLTGEQLKQLTEAAVKGATGPLTQQIVEISEKLGVTVEAARRFLKIVGEDPNIPEDKLGEALGKVADAYQNYKAQLAGLKPDNPTAQKLLDEAKREIEAGHFDRVRELLREATQAQLDAAQEAHKLKEQAQAAEDAQMLGAASSTAADGDLVLIERKYPEAAELFGRAAGYVPSGHPNESGHYLERQAGAFFLQGDERGDNAALGAAISVDRSILQTWPREQDPEAWARTERNLGLALETLGDREGSTDLLEQAVTANRAALEVRTRDRNPVGWAIAEITLGNSLEDLGERESSTGKQDEAIKIYHEVLQVVTSTSAPLPWANAQENLCVALNRLAERDLMVGDTGPARSKLKGAVEACNEALKVYTLARTAKLWLGAKMTLGDALVDLGELTPETDELENAAAVYREVSTDDIRGVFPGLWATSKMGLGGALFQLGLREVSLGWTEFAIGKFDQSIAAYNLALEESTRLRDEELEAKTNLNLGNCQAELATLTKSSVLMGDAIKSTQAAADAFQQAGDSSHLAIAQRRITTLRADLDELKR